MAEVRDKRSHCRLFKSRVLDVNDRERAIIDDVLKADLNQRGVTMVYGHSLQNSQIHRQVQSLSAAKASEAD